MRRIAPPLFAFTLAAASGAAGARATEGDPPSCDDPVPVYEHGRTTSTVCADEAPDRGLAVIDLSDGWAPRVFAEDDPYRPVYVALANGRTETAEGDAVHLEDGLSVFGVFPTPRRVGRRLLQESRHLCHRAVDDRPLTMAAVQEHLGCERLLEASHRTGRLDARTREALYTYQRRNFLFGRGELDRATHDALSTDSREVDFQHLLRVLRERVVDATGLIEDGSAGKEPGTVLGRYLDPPRLRRTEGEPLPDAAPDRIAKATEAAAAALGWTHPGSARDFFASRPESAFQDLRVAVRLPPLPDYHGASMEMRLEIRRGDVWYDFPYDEQGERRAQPVDERPSLVLYVRHADRDVALARWPTTIGGWRREVNAEGELGLRYKESPVGARWIRDVLVAPAWLPPSSTPDDELMRRGEDGRWVADERIVGPGWASAFGLVMLVHHDDADGEWIDEGIRTHGTASYRSVLEGHSHGCHRLHNHLAVRLGGFLLAHRAHEARGPQGVRYVRRLAHEGDRDVLRVTSRGYLYALDPPVSVLVRPGRVRGERGSPPEELRSPPSP